VQGARAQSGRRARAQGFCCLMQLSTRAEDFVVDALALRSHIGPVLGPIFADPGVRAAAGRRAAVSAGSTSDQREVEQQA